MPAERMVEPRAAWRAACATSASGVTREPDGSKQQLGGVLIFFSLIYVGRVEIKRYMQPKLTYA